MVTRARWPGDSCEDRDLPRAEGKLRQTDHQDPMVEVQCQGGSPCCAEVRKPMCQGLPEA